MPARNIRLEISYDGTEYYGWQRQKGFISIQELLETAVQKTFGHQTVFEGAGRTDGGVHALCFTCNFLLEPSAIPVEKIPMILNNELPKAIHVMRAREVPLDFHARFTCTAREYFYFLMNARETPPFLRHYAYPEFRPLDYNKVREACSLFVGTHSFRSFASSYPGEFDYKRTVHYFRVARKGNHFYYFIKGNGFLHGMIRDLVSVTIHYARGNVSRQQILDALEEKLILPPALRTRAPGCGLYFKRAFYPAPYNSL